VFAGSELRLTAVGRTHVERRAANANANSAVAVTPCNGPSLGLADTQSLFARLVLRQVRSGHQPASLAVAVIGSPFALRSAKRVTVADRASSHPLTTPIETLFCELARRHLRQLAFEEKP
jgi:hypothetical protein